ncbi:MAG: hypothetical protein Fur009_2940 [Candidatus Microgenomates bacterium]
MKKTNVYFEKINNKKIFCYFTETSNSNNKVIIMSHGFRGSSLGPARTFVNFERLLVNEGYSVLRFDQPNCGNSDGDFLNASFKEWVKTIIYFAKKFIKENYKVCLLGQSMGATASLLAATNKSLEGKIKTLILWVPDPKSYVEVLPNKIYEESGEIYKGIFWLEAKDMNFLEKLKKFNGKIHLVYGQSDCFVDKRDVDDVIKIIKKRKDRYMILKGEDHSKWRYASAKRVFKEELEFLENNF